MTETTHNPPAFPTWDRINNAQVHLPKGGMTLRDYFAAAALQGILANDFKKTAGNNPTATSELAYLIADAMLTQRANP